MGIVMCLILVMDLVNMIIRTMIAMVVEVVWQELRRHIIALMVRLVQVVLV